MAEKQGEKEFQRELRHKGGCCYCCFEWAVYVVSMHHGRVICPFGYYTTPNHQYGWLLPSLIRGRSHVDRWSMVACCRLVKPLCFFSVGFCFVKKQDEVTKTKCTTQHATCRTPNLPICRSTCRRDNKNIPVMHDQNVPVCFWACAPCNNGGFGIQVTTIYIQLHLHLVRPIHSMASRAS